ncbi:MAG: hypothetical protein JSR96_15500 [Proteobacteria bacterium]|nr:hypothetical protein [Pseudomonadota bacterium]
MPGNQREKNDAVRRSLAGYGDDGTADRDIIHYAYPYQGTDLSPRPQIIASLKSQGFAVRDAASHAGLVFEHTGAVADPNFDALTEQLESWFAGQRWEYDGWECAVVKPDA